MANIFHTIVYPGEDRFQAICRAGSEAVRNGFDGYSIDCEKCGQPIDDHETPQDCIIWRRELGSPLRERVAQLVAGWRGGKKGE
jgi:hypothetical protein